MKYRHSDIYFIFQKSATTVAYLCLLVLTWRFIDGKLDVHFAAGCTLVSGFWCLLTRVKMFHFLHTYFDVFSRLEIVMPCVFGMGMSTAALFAHSNGPTRTVNVIEMMFWLMVYMLYLQNKKKYVKQGYGPVPKGTWVNPPPDVMRAGDLILTSGNVAKRLHESVGHAAAVIEIDGKKMAISSHMDRGTTVDPVEEVIQEVGSGHYLLLHLTQPVTEELSERMANIALIMARENKEWRDGRNAAWQAFVEKLPLPESAKQFLLKIYHCTGYDWLGMFMGRLAQDNWTCIGAALEMYRKAGVKTNPYGTGLLGFGTGLLDPIMPVRFLADPAFKLVMREGEQPPDEAMVFRKHSSLVPLS